MKIKKYTYCLLIMLFPLLLQGQAQDPFYPRNLGEAINSIYSEIKPVLTPDGNTLYFVRVDHPGNKFGEMGSQDVWFSTRSEDGSWIEAQRMPDEINIGRYNSVLSVTDQGKTLLINGTYNKQGTYWKGRGLSVVKKEEHGWGKPVPVKIRGYHSMSKGETNDAFLSADGNTLLLSFSEKINSKNQNIYISFMNPNGSWSRPRKLEGLNTKFTDEAPSLTADNKTIYFTSNRRSQTNFDIYKSERLDDHSWEKWSTPTLLNDTINSYYWESFFQVNRKGSMAYFTSNNGSLGGSDIYEVKLFEEHPYVAVSGKVLNKNTQSPIPLDVAYEVLINNLSADSLSINPETGEYKAVLPLGKSYSIRAAADNYKSQSVVIDATEWVEYTEVTKDLLMEPFDYVSLSGNLILKNTNQKLTADVNPMVYINGQKSDNVKLDFNTGSYQVNLPFGQQYELAVYTTKYEAIPEKLDLRDVKEFRQVMKNLFAEEQLTATIVGKIFDKKTGKPFRSGTPVNINVDDETIKFVQIDSVTREYKLELALGRSYILNASAESYYPITEIVDVSNEKQKIRIYKDLYLVPLEVGQAIRLNNIFFETGKAVLMQESFVELDRVVKFLTENPSVKIEIGGHTDNVGSAALNNNLSDKRARSVAEYILRKGIPADAISSKGYGFSKPVAPNTTAAGRQLNRRVEFTIKGT